MFQNRGILSYRVRVVNIRVCFLFVDNLFSWKLRYIIHDFSWPSIFIHYCLWKLRHQKGDMWQKWNVYHRLCTVYGSRQTIRIYRTAHDLWPCDFNMVWRLHALQSESLCIVAWNQRPWISSWGMFLLEVCMRVHKASRVVAGGPWWISRRPTISQTCSMDDMSGERAGQGSSDTHLPLKEGLHNPCHVWPDIVLLKYDMWSCLKEGQYLGL